MGEHSDKVSLGKDEVAEKTQVSADSHTKDGHVASNQHEEEDDGEVCIL